MSGVELASKSSSAACRVVDRVALAREECSQHLAGDRVFVHDVDRCPVRGLRHGSGRGSVGRRWGHALVPFLSRGCRACGRLTPGMHERQPVRVTYYTTQMAMTVPTVGHPASSGTRGRFTDACRPV